MTLYVENANDIILKNVKLLSNKSEVADGSFVVSICENHSYDISALTVGATTTIEMATAIPDIANGDTILVRRVRGASDANGFWTASGVSGASFDIAADTSIQTYLGGGKAWRVLVQEATFEYREDIGGYLCVIENTDVELTPDANYLLFIEESDKQVAIEFEDTAEIRER